MTGKIFLEKINDVLKNLESDIPEIQSCFICSSFGLPITNASTANDLVRLSAETSAILSVSEHAALDSSMGLIDNIVIQGKNSIMVITTASPDAVLSVKADSKVRLGLLLFEIKKSANKISKLFIQKNES